jgi:hypothetical protein
MKEVPWTVKVEPVDSRETNSTVTGPVPTGRIPVTTPLVGSVAEAGAGVGGGVDGVIVIRRGRIVDCPVEEVAVRMKSPVAWTVVFTEPVAGRSLPTPLMLTFAAPDVSHENVVSRGAQPVAGLAVKLAIVGAVEKAFRLTASGMAVPSLVWLSFRMAYG